MDLVCVAGLFIGPDEVPKSDRIVDVVGVREGIQTQGLFEAGDEDGNHEGVEARVQQDQVLGERRHIFVLLLCKVLDFRNDVRLD
jgi:hypothetical protein